MTRARDLANGETRFLNASGDTMTGNLALSSDGTSSSGNLFGAARGRQISLTTSWVTFATLRSATNTGIRLKVISGHNSGVNTHYEANSDTYSYNIANGTVVTFTTGNGSPGTCSVRKVKNTSYGGDGGWDYQIVAASSYGTLAWIDVMGADTSWEWKI